MFVPSAARPGGGKRGKIQGWSAQAARRHVAWLQSVDPEHVGPQGFAVTLTLRDTPPSAQVWGALRRAWLKRVERMGAVRWHWVVEWQRRGTPHLHGAVYFPDDDETPGAVRAAFLVRAWLDVAAAFGPQVQAQRVERLSDPAKWARYCAKHSARSSAHYQRQGKGPEGWESTGRLWGHGGAWPTREPRELDVELEGWYHLRRLVKSWRIADASRERDQVRRAERMRSARRMLSQDTRRASSVCGAREWVPEPVMARMLEWVSSAGYRVSADQASSLALGVGQGPAAGVPAGVAAGPGSSSARHAAARAALGLSEAASTV